MHKDAHESVHSPTMHINLSLSASKSGGGGDAVAEIGKKCGNMRTKCGKCGKKCDRKCGLVIMVFAPQNPYVSCRLAQFGAQSMDGLMEQLGAVVQLKNITD